MTKWVSLTLVFFFLPSCFWTHRYKNVEMHGSVSEVQIPADLWDLIESIYTQEEAVRERLSEKDEGKRSYKLYSVMRKRSKVQTPFKYMTLNVKLIENNYGILGKKDYNLEYGLGGGDLDFARFVKSQEGSFKIEFELGEDHKEAEDFKVFYWANGRARKIDDEIFGSGCKNFYDLTGFFKQKVFVRGIAATTHRRKYVSSLSGTYIFVIKKEGALYISQLTMRDSRYGVLQCRT